MDLVLSLDIGTSKLAAVVGDCASRQIVAWQSVPNSATRTTRGEGCHEQDPEVIWRACRGLLRCLCESDAFDPRLVRTLAITGQMHGVLLVDPACRPCTHLITWCDRRAAALPAVLAREAWPAARTGCALHAGYGGATLSALATAGAIPKGARALTIADYIAARLSGIVATPSAKTRWRRRLSARRSVCRASLPTLPKRQLRGRRGPRPERRGTGHDDFCTRLERRQAVCHAVA